MTHEGCNRSSVEANAAGTEVRTSEIEGPIATGDQEGDEMKVQQLPLWKLGTWRFLIGLMKVGVTKAPRVKSVVRGHGSPYHGQIAEASNTALS